MIIAKVYKLFRVRDGKLLSVFATKAAETVYPRGQWVRGTLGPVFAFEELGDAIRGAGDWTSDFPEIRPVELWECWAALTDDYQYILPRIDTRSVEVITAFWKMSHTGRIALRESHSAIVGTVACARVRLIKKVWAWND